jgi:hypothetical protein
VAREREIARARQFFLRLIVGFLAVVAFIAPIVSDPFLVTPATAQALILASHSAMAYSGRKLQFGILCVALAMTAFAFAAVAGKACSTRWSPILLQARLILLCAPQMSESHTLVCRVFAARETTTDDGAPPS